MPQETPNLPGIAVVFGASGGIGSALVAALSQNPRYVEVLGFSRSGPLTFDLTDEASIAAAATRIAQSGQPLRTVIDATGALAADDKVFDGACRQAGVTRAATVEEAFEAAATFATQPLPKGPNTVVMTTAGGWGVVTSDAISRRAAAATSSTALSNAASLAFDGTLKPLSLRTNCSDASRISSSVAGGSKLNRVLKLRHMVPSSHRTRHGDHR